MEATRSAPAVTPHLSLWDTVSIIVGIIIGVGIYSVPAKVLGYTWDPWLAVALWVFAGILCLFGALCYAELAATYPRSGGDYEYLTRAYGRWVGFVFAFAQLTAIRSGGGIAAVAYLMSPYAARLFGLNENDSWTCIGLAAIPIVGLSVLNALGVYLGKWTQNGLTILKIAGLGAIVVVGFGWAQAPLGSADETVLRHGRFIGYRIYPDFRSGPWSIELSQASAIWELWGLFWAPAKLVRSDTVAGLPDEFVVTVDGRKFASADLYSAASSPGPKTADPLLKGMGVCLIVERNKVTHVRASTLSEWARLALALIAILWTYSGWHEAAYVAAEVREPRRTLPRALLLGTLIVMGIYLLIQFAMLAGLGFDRLADNPTPAADVLALALGDNGAKAMCVLVVLSCLGALNGMIFTSARLYAVLGEDHALFRPLEKWSPRWRTPLRAIVLQGVLCLGMILLVGLWFGGEKGFDQLLACTAAVFWLFFALTGCALFVLRRREPNRERSFRVPLYPVTPVVFIVCCLGMMIGSVLSAPLESAIGLGVLLLGAPLYLLSEHWARPGAAPVATERGGESEAAVPVATQETGPVR